MSQHKKPHTQLIAKILLTGVLLAFLIYLFHPDTGQFSIIINGQEVADPLVRLAVIPSILAVLFFAGILSIFAFLGVSMMMFFGGLILVLLAIFFIAPFSWPILLFMFFMILLLSSDGNQSR